MSNLLESLLELPQVDSNVDASVSTSDRAIPPDDGVHEAVVILNENKDSKSFKILMPTAGGGMAEQQIDFKGLPYSPMKQSEIIGKVKTNVDVLSWEKLQWTLAIRASVRNRIGGQVTENFWVKSTPTSSGGSELFDFAKAVGFTVDDLSGKSNLQVIKMIVSKFAVAPENKITLPAVVTAWVAKKKAGEYYDNIPGKRGMKKFPSRRNLEKGVDEYIPLNDAATETMTTYEISCYHAPPKGTLVTPTDSLMDLS